MMGNYYLQNPRRRWAAVCISKNACTSLKKAVLDDAGLKADNHTDIHHRIGYWEDGRFLTAVKKGKPPGVFVFAVWRDPVERFLSAFRHFVFNHHPGYLAGYPKTLDAWIGRAEIDLLKPVEDQDEHLRRQADYYSMEGVDAVVALTDLADWYEGRGWGTLPFLNASGGAEISLSPEQESRLRALYARDYEEVRPTVSMGTGKPIVTSLWIGRRLPPLARLSAQSYLDHGFHFRLMSYGAVEGVPDGVETCDAAGILPRHCYYQHGNGSLAPFSDWFRYRLLHDHGGMWSDLDMVCMKPFKTGSDPWFAFEGDGIIANGLLRFPKGDPLLIPLLSLAEEPAFPMPWDDAEAIEAKEELRRRHHSPRERRVHGPWGNAGPASLTGALQASGRLSQAAPKEIFGPAHWTRWQSLYNGTRSLDELEFQDALVVHLWGDMIRREGVDLRLLSEDSIVASLMRRHGIRSPRLEKVPASGHPDTARILVGICSCLKNAEQRQVIRETWAGKKEANVECLFFIGSEDEAATGEADLLQVKAPDGYANLPEKVTAFFRAALAHHDFDWLFKCDDDTYVALDRLKSLVGEGHELVGNEFLQSRGSPSGGAGYLLSRRLVALLAADPSIPPTGDEDVLIGEAAIRHGAVYHATSRLCWNASRYPRHDNDVITSHWCRPRQLRAIHSLYHRPADLEVAEVHHPDWSDKLSFSREGFFARHSTGCMGTWSNGGATRTLKWFDWGEEQLKPSLHHGTGKSFHCVKTPVEELIVELRGGLGNQMFQYAHALALSRRFNLKLKVVYANYGRDYGLGIFGVKLDPVDPDEPFEWFEYNEDLPGNGSWPAASAIRNSASRRIRLAGYFQSERFFGPVIHELRDLFQLPARRPRVGEGSTPVCIHVRRGDFVGSSAHAVCSEAYYRDAMRMMRGLVEKPVFVVFSDDPSWCRRFFEPMEENVIVPDKLPERETLETMLGCQAFILSNSTFAWWAAWMSGSPLVIAPSRYLNGRSWTICPERWIQMPAEGLQEPVSPALR